MLFWVLSISLVILSSVKDWVHLDINEPQVEHMRTELHFAHGLNKLYTGVLVNKNISIHRNIYIHRYIGCFHETEIQFFKICGYLIGRKIGQAVKFGVCF